MLWTDNKENVSEYILYGQSLSLSQGPGISVDSKSVYAAYPVDAFEPETQKAYLPADAGWFPISAFSNGIGLKKLNFGPACNFLQLKIYNESSSTTLHSITVKSDVALCGEGDIAFYTDGRPYAKYTSNKGSKKLSLDMGSTGVPLSSESPVTVTVPLPGCIEVNSISVDYTVTEGTLSADAVFDPASLSLGETLVATVGKTSNLYDEERNTTPYKDLDWSKVCWINTTSHVHCEDDRTLENLRKHNIEFFTLSNYHPAMPTYPAGEMKAGRRGVPVTNYPLVRNGILQNGPFDWNEILGEWKSQLSNDLQAQLPFKESEDLMFPSWVPGTLEAPNAEHYSFKFDGKYFEMHLCCPGSAYCSGTFDAHDTFGTEKYGGFNHGTGQHWKKGIDNMIKDLVCPTGGGVTLNHPGWSELTMDMVFSVLDYDARVLGIEILNSGDNDEDYWDKVLATGRQCFGFCVPDHGAQDKVPSDIFGVNVLLVHSRTAKDCLEAYRKGNFYGAIRGYGELLFTYIRYDGSILRAETDKPALFDVITEKGVVYSTSGTSMEYTPSGVYARIRATASDGSGEVLYSQPFIL